MIVDELELLDVLTVLIDVVFVLELVVVLVLVLELLFVVIEEPVEVDVVEVVVARFGPTITL